ncbi:MAG: hypothetical protein HYT12_04885 [Candidatus Liptonbacteria bacterium]|nr:hypothetical protein [Candidatus Liptonbacteria bacterium]
MKIRVKDAIIPMPAFAFLMVVVLVVVGVELGISYASRDISKVADGVTCVPKQFEIKSSSDMYLTLDCNGKEFWIEDPKTLIAFANGKKVAPCTLYKTGRASCTNN